MSEGAGGGKRKTSTHQQITRAHHRHRISGTTGSEARHGRSGGPRSGREGSRRPWARLESGVRPRRDEAEVSEKQVNLGGCRLGRSRSRSPPGLVELRQRVQPGVDGLSLERPGRLVELLDLPVSLLGIGPCPNSRLLRNAVMTGPGPAAAEIGAPRPAPLRSLAAESASLSAPSRGSRPC